MRPPIRETSDEAFRPNRTQRALNQLMRWETILWVSTFLIGWLCLAGVSMEGILTGTTRLLLVGGEVRITESVTLFLLTMGANLLATALPFLIVGLRRYLNTRVRDTRL